MYVLCEKSVIFYPNIHQNVFDGRTATGLGKIYGNPAYVIVQH